MIDNRIVKASFSSCSIEDRRTFKNSSCLLTISVGQLAHESKKFLATLTLINKSFKRCTIIVGDTLQRHNYLNSHTAKESYDLALQAGTEWVARNYAAISQLAIDYEISRWDDWLSHPDFENKLNLIKERFSTDKEYQNAYFHSINSYIERNKFQASPQLTDNCLNYLLEECAIMLLWAENGYNYEVYPSHRTEAMAATYNIFIKPHFPNTLKFSSLRFKKYFQTYSHLLKLTPNQYTPVNIAT